MKEQAIGCNLLELSEWAAIRSGHSISEVRRLLRDAGYRLYRIRAHELVPLAVKAVIDSENAITSARAPKPRHGQQVP